MVEPATGTIVFVEVRYRGDVRRGGAAASVDARKRGRLRLAASAWLQRHADPRRPARIDVVGLAPGARAGAPVRARPGEPVPVAWEGYALLWLPGAVGG